MRAKNELVKLRYRGRRAFRVCVLVVCVCCVCPLFAPSWVGGLEEGLFVHAVFCGLRLVTQTLTHASRIVDLVRNDFSRCCDPASVTVAKLCDIESYETVHQMVSTVRGKVRKDCTFVDVMKAAFPGGSMTGAPKKRTMEIIGRLEEEERGVYSGSVGYVGVDGRASLNIVIRTAVVFSDRVEVGCGGAITWLSEEGDEYEEMRTKGRVVEEAVKEAVKEAAKDEEREKGEADASADGNVGELLRGLVTDVKTRR